MSTCNIHIISAGCTLAVPAGANLLQALREAKYIQDAPCGGHGTCGKCGVLVDGQFHLACQYTVNRDISVSIPQARKAIIADPSVSEKLPADGKHAYVLAFDIGTTTVACYLLHGHTGKTLAQASCLNPQASYGADVISRLQYVFHHRDNTLQAVLLEALASLTREAAEKAGIRPEEITLAAIVGNTAMHHLLLNIDPKPLTTPPYMPSVFEAMELPTQGYLPIAPTGHLRILPNIAGFVGADTVGCLAAAQFDRLDKLTLMLDIGTNGEMVLGDKNGFLVCSTAAGPAFEGAKIFCGMRGTEGAIDHVWLENGSPVWHVIGDIPPVGLCGSGLLDLVAVLLETEGISGTGRMPAKQYTLPGTPVCITQQDVREVQLAKGALRAGIELLCQQLGRQVEEIETVLLAGAFGSYMDPASACRIGLIPPCLIDKIQAIGNAAGTGAKLCAVNEAAFTYSKHLAAKAQFVELASLPQFQDCFVSSLSFEEDEDD